MRRPVVLWLALSLVACGQTPPPRETPVPLGAPVPGALYGNYFLPGAKAAEGPLTVVDAGMLDVPTGRLIAADPYLLADDRDAVPPFHVRVPKGRYPVQAAVVTFDDSGWRTPAAVRVLISEAPVAAWRPATKGAERAAELGPDEYYGFTVDVATGVFLDAAALPALTRLASGADSPLDLAMRGDPDALVYDLRDKESNIVAYFAGYGDGVYGTWIGFDAADRPVQFVTDLEVVAPPR